LLTGGGSGGHIIPNLAVAKAIKDREPKTELLYIASRNRLDADLLKKAGLPYARIFSGKLRRYFSWRNFVDPFFVLLGFFQSFFIIIRFWPNVVFSKGGFVSLPVVLAAFILRRRIVLHESDSRMGLANRISSKLASVVCVAFPALVKTEKKYRLTGNPIRPEIAEGSSKEGFRLTGFEKGLPVLLVWGGSQGSAEINDMIEKDFDKFTDYFQIVHITGAGKSISKNSPHYVHFEYLDADLKHIYAITDLIIGRAGANSLYEIAYLKKPNIMIPLGNSDQLGNARYFEEMGAGMICRKGERLFDLALNLWQNQSLRKQMEESLGEISAENASDKIVKIILGL
jgi:UDP-N-acetylglucosamine--N-acetylmuramyl-(pentapeptide) pyrophosphoryl-undecaprenol N-acetylglucosamine transferase